MLQNLKSLSSSYIKLVKSLQLKKFRIKENAFLVEGDKMVKALSNSSYQVKALIGQLHWLQTLSPWIQQQQIPCYVTNTKTLSRIGHFKTNTNGLAVVQGATMKPITLQTQDKALVLDRIQDPGNLGTILRTADWYGIPHIICSNDTVDLYHPKVIQASMGGWMSLNIFYTDLVPYLQQVPVPIIGACLHSEHVYDFTFPKGGALVIGNESTGLTPAVRALCQQCITIPGKGQTTSLNAAMATAILCDHWYRSHC